MLLATRVASPRNSAVSATELVCLWWSEPLPRGAFYRCAGDQTGWLSRLPAARVRFRWLLPSAFMR
jgi:hypothetical protein